MNNRLIETKNYTDGTFWQKLNNNKKTHTTMVTLSIIKYSNYIETIVVFCHKEVYKTYLKKKSRSKIRFK